MFRIVLKFGTGVLARPGGRSLDAAQFRHFAADVSALVEQGHSCVIVSSAAIAAGVHTLGLDKRPEDLAGKQACAAAGQPELMRQYSTAFRRHGLTVAQLLLTHGDIDSRQRRTNARSTLERLFRAKNVVPIINENDSVAVEELRFGDNDRLSAEVASLVEARLLLLLTSSNGLTDSQKVRIPIVKDIKAAFDHVRPEKGDFSVGGMHTKLEAVQQALNNGIEAFILDGKRKGQIASAVAGRDAGTRFPVARKKPSKNITK